MGKDRETIARELALAHGYEWDTTEEAVRDAWLKRADAVEEAPSVCGKCGGRGFTEKEHGLVSVFCDCEKGKELRAEVTGEAPNVVGTHIIPPPNETIIVEGGENVIPLGSSVITSDEFNLISKELTDDNSRSMDNSGYEGSDGSSGRTERVDSPTGGGDTGQPKLKQKPKSKKKARKKSS